MKRCEWVNEKELYIKYHDEEWGEPVHDDRLLFEMLTLESAQAGLSWFTILKRRTNYKKAFDNFKVEKIAKYNDDKVSELLNNEGIIRNKLKINATINNAKKFIKIQKEFGSFNKYIWGFVNNKPILNEYESIKEVPAKTKLSEEISKDLKKKGFKFIGPTIVYAFMQAIGMVNDHTKECFKYKKK